MTKLFVIKNNEPTPLKIASSLAKKGEEVEITMIQNSIYLTDSRGEHSEAIQECIKSGVKIYVLKKDAEKRGLSSNLVEGVKIVDYSQLIDHLFSDKLTVINL
jgi:sulfur relay protein TusB/DsrH